MHIGHRPEPLGQRTTEAAGELRQQIRELETELVAATRKLADARSRSETIERRAMDAVRAGDDRVARDALVELQPHVEEAALIEADIKVLRALLSECDDFLRHSSGSTEPPSPKVIANNQLHLRRDDLAALTAAYLRESRAPRQWALVGAGVGGLALGASLITLGGLLGWFGLLAVLS